MSSDRLSNASLLPNYELPWEELLERLVKFLLCEEVSVETRVDREMAVIKSKGCILGQESSVESNTAWDDREKVNINYNNREEQRRYMTLQASAGSIQ
jgi:hypothetical protein